MGVPLSQMWAVTRYVLAQRIRRRRRYPLVLMLEPLLRCNLACPGCGKIQHPPEVLRRQLSPEACFEAADACGAPMVSIPGGEPLLHPQIDTIVAGLVARKKYVYLCTNALRLEESLSKFTPSKFLSFSVHIDGPRDLHDHAVARDGTYDIAIRAIRAAIARGFRVTTNTTVFTGTDPAELRIMFDSLSKLGVEGFMISPGYAYEKAEDQAHFLHREQTTTLFRELFAMATRRWRFNQSPLFLDFLQGNRNLECTPWGNPTFNIFGWQRPCYLIDEGYTETFDSLMETTSWESYGRSSGNPKCRDCMVHCGYEPTAVATTFGSLRGLAATVAATVRMAVNRRRAARTEAPGSTPIRPGRPPRALVELQVTPSSSER